MEKVGAKNVVANGYWNHFSGKKKFGICCGNCGYSWTEKIRFDLSDEAQAICPSCKIINCWYLRSFAKRYEKWFENRRA